LVCGGNATVFTVGGQRRVVDGTTGDSDVLLKVGAAAGAGGGLEDCEFVSGTGYVAAGEAGRGDC
jgi:hypothetical protein